MESTVQRHFAQASTHWGRRYADESRGMADLDLLLRRECFQRMLEPIIAGSERALDLLDVGCGSGDVLDGIPRDRVRVTGLDFVPQMLSAARQSHPTDRFAAADAGALPIAAESVDVVTCAGLLEYVALPDQTIASIASVLKPDGVLVISFPNSGSLFRQLLRVERGAERAATGLRAWLRSDSRGKSVAPAYRHRQWSMNQACRLLREHRMHVDDVRLVTFGPWGRLGRLRVAKAISAHVTRRWRRPNIVTRHLAATIIVRAIKRGPGCKDSNPKG